MELEGLSFEEIRFEKKCIKEMCVGETVYEEILNSMIHRGSIYCRTNMSEFQ
jgi:hypothetical protein